MRIFTSLFIVAFLTIGNVSAEGTRQVAPNGNIVIMGNSTTDVAALHINNPSYNSFGAYDNPNPQSRLNIYIKNPATECIYVGFSSGHNNITGTNPPSINYEYRIKDPNGNVVFGPVSVTPAEANITNWSEGFTGAMQIHGAGGYVATQVTSINLASQGWTGSGDYYIEFRDIENNDFLIDFWDITVADCSGGAPIEKQGRLWSYNWSIFAINDYGFPFRPFNGAFFVCAPDPDNENASFVTRIDFNGSGFQPAAFNVAFNSFGIENTGTVSEDRKSVENMNATKAEYAIFLNDPIDICETANIGEISILGVSRCNGEDYCIKFTTSKAGQVDLLLDFDGPDNMYTPGTADIIISRTVTADEVGVPSCVFWDGRDGLGNPMFEDIGTQIPITIAYAQGIYHFPIYDAELMTNGFTIASVRPVASVSLLFYDDSNISVPSLSGEPAMQLSGCSTPCHRWTNYTQPNIPGFGNLNTINSWWFSQLIIRQDVFFLPSYYTCEIEGPTNFCQGGTSQLTFKPQVIPAGASESEIISTNWTGPGIIGSNAGSSITIGSAGTYTVSVQWLTPLGDTCESACEYSVTVDPPLTGSLDTLIVQGETIVINGETFDEGGVYTQELSASNGCDSILTINIILLSTIINYDLNACESFMSNGSHMDYSEFLPSYPQPLPCATITAGILYRPNPQVNKHSCTPGVNDSPGMCVTTLDGCTYVPGHESSVIIEINITPDPDTAVHLTGFSFYQKAPLMYSWISGNSGPNNYPTWFRVRVLKNGSEIFLTPAMPTTLTWTETILDFLPDDQFLVKDPTTFQFELLSYCPVGNGATESVWDLDEVNIVASCASLSGFNKSISGRVLTQSGIAIPDVEMHLYDEPTLSQSIVTIADEDGRYSFTDLVPEVDYYVHGFDNTDFLNGVNTLDLIRLQKHLLGIQLFDAPYQFIAADANKSNSVSVIDLIELRKLILGIYTVLPRNTSWRFGIAEQDLEIGFPWVFKETYSIEYLDEHLTRVDFIGVKIGDLNGDVEVDATSASVDIRGSEKLMLNITDQQLIAGVPVKVDITSDQWNDIAGIQLALRMDGAEILDFIGGSLPVEKENYSIAQDGSFRLSWNSIDLSHAAADKVLFSLVVVAQTDMFISEILHVQKGQLHPEVYIGESLNILDVDVEITSPVASVIQNRLFQNEPNPFSTSTTIRFQLEQSGEATIRIVDLSGRLILERKGDFTKGMNAVELAASELGTSNGILICQLQTSGFVTTQSMVVVR
jgi:hypothetical protein